MCMIKIAGACILAAQLTGGGTYNPQLPQVAHSYDGEARDVSRFYQTESQPFTIAGGVLIEDTLIHVDYDSGYTTQKMRVADSATVHATQYFDISDKLELSVTAGASFGGEQTDTACTDSFGREYYCGTLKSWSTYETPESDRYLSGSIKVKYRF